MSTKNYADETSDIVGTLKDGRILARARENFIVTIPPHYCQVNIPNLELIDCIIDINIRNVSPKALVYGICDKQITVHTDGTPIVGFTVANIATGITATGTTITAEVVVCGW